MGSSPLARGLLRILRAFGPRWRIIPARAGFTNLAFDGSFILEDHPRSRGVYAAAAWEQTKAAGSSPLARGLPRDRQPRGGPRRIIPARAGFTSSSTSSSTSSRDHPRSRGVYASSSSTSEGEEGSSPLARGLRSNDDSAGGEGGIIPARAGFTVFDVGAGCDRGDHPRSRGVYSSPVRASPRRFGSSPLARGLRAGPPIPGAEAGIIPARAGFTGPPGTRPPPWPDHPRSRGVYQVPDPLNICLTGSSPLARGLRPSPRIPRPRGRIIPARAGFTRFVMCISTGMAGSSPLARGLLFNIRESGLADGIIPARAGFTRPGTDGPTEHPDHPRSRGVYVKSPVHGIGTSGSSPLARGLLPAARRPVGPTGIIPARAGFTPSGRPRGSPRRDHPRSRGVYSGVGVLWWTGVGSSPLARGLRSSSSSCTDGGRIIPARAGFTPAASPAAPTHTDHPRSRGVYALLDGPAAGP